jgi:hypothetical protein
MRAVTLSAFNKRGAKDKSATIQNMKLYSVLDRKWWGTYRLTLCDSEIILPEKRQHIKYDIPGSRNEKNNTLKSVNILASFTKYNWIAF